MTYAPYNWLPTQRILLTGSENIPRPQFTSMIQVMESILIRVWRRNDILILPDDYGVPAQALRFARRWGMKYQVCGNTVRPRNGAPLGHYTRIVGGDATAFMIGTASHVICLSTGQLFIRGGQRDPVYATFRQAVAAGKWVTWWSESTGVGWPVVLGEKPPRPQVKPISPPFPRPYPVRVSVS